MVNNMRQPGAGSRSTRSAIQKLLADFWSGRVPPNEALAEALRRHPRLLSHPLMWGQLWQLHQQSLRGDDDDAREARGAFRQLVEAWVHGVLPDWRLIPPVGRRGRKVVWEERLLRISLVEDYEELLKKLKQEHVRRWPGETDGAWRRRLIAIESRVWDASDASLYLAFTRKNKRGGRTGGAFRVALRSRDVETWVDEAIERAGDAATLRDHLAYHLAGYRYTSVGGKPVTAGQVRGFIQQER